jgi:hypothetical protein
MPILVSSLRNFGSDSFTATLKRELETLGSGVLPLERGTTQGGRVDDSNLSATIIRVGEDAQFIRALVGVFFSEIVGGCSCGDEPVAENAYCEIQVLIDKQTGEAEFAVVSE